MCTAQSLNCVLNSTYGCEHFVPSNACRKPQSRVWTRGKCEGVFKVGNRSITCGPNKQCAFEERIEHPLPAIPMPKESTCLVLFACSRYTKSPLRYLNDIYLNRIPRWLTFGFDTFSVDSCANMSVNHQGLKIPGVTPLNFNGSTSYCVSTCPTQREKTALRFADLHLPSKCRFVFKITAKYFAPMFGREFERIPAGAEVVAQYGTYSGRPEKQQSEIYGIRRDLIVRLLDEKERNAERQLWLFTRKRCARLHRMNQMHLNNFTRRSDNKILTFLR